MVGLLNSCNEIAHERLEALFILILTKLVLHSICFILGSSKSCNGSKWVEMSRNGSKLSEMGPDNQIWVRNGSDF